VKIRISSLLCINRRNIELTSFRKTSRRDRKYICDSFDYSEHTCTQFSLMCVFLLHDLPSRISILASLNEMQAHELMISFSRQLPTFGSIWRTSRLSTPMTAAPTVNRRETNVYRGCSRFVSHNPGYRLSTITWLLTAGSVLCCEIQQESNQSD